MFGSLLQGAAPTEGSSSQPVPPGYYEVAITDVEMRDNNKGWKGAQFEFTIQSGPHKGRKAWETFTVAMNPTDKMPANKLPEFLKEQAGHIVGILKAAGHPTPNNPDGAPIKGRKLGVKLIVADKKRDGQSTGEKQNKVVAWGTAAEVASKVAGGAGARPLGGGLPAGMLGMSVKAGAPLAGLTAGVGIGSVSSSAGITAPLDDEIPF